MIKNSLRKAYTSVELKHKRPICKDLNHNWQQVYTENNSLLNKIEEVHISWCKQQNEYVLINKINT